MEPTTPATPDDAQACVLRHRVQIKRLRRTVEAMVNALQLELDRRPATEQQIREVTAGDRNGRRRAALLKAARASTGAAALNDIVAALGRLHALERQADGIPPGWSPPAASSDTAQPEVQQPSDEVFERIRRKVFGMESQD